MRERDTLPRSISTPYGGVSPWPSTGRSTTTSRRGRSFSAIWTNGATKAFTLRPSMEWEPTCRQTQVWRKEQLPKPWGHLPSLLRGCTCSTCSRLLGEADQLLYCDTDSVFLVVGPGRPLNPLEAGACLRSPGDRWAIGSWRLLGIPYSRRPVLHRTFYSVGTLEI